jgi:hypothetical protein
MNLYYVYLPGNLITTIYAPHEIAVRYKFNSPTKRVIDEALQELENLSAFDPKVEVICSKVDSSIDNAMDITFQRIQDSTKKELKEEFALLVKETFQLKLF